VTGGARSGRRAVLLLVVLAVAAGATAVPARTGPLGPGGGRTRYRADRLVDRIIDGRPVTTLLGNVRITRDTTSIASDTARFYRDEELYVFRGHITMTQGRTVLTCRDAAYSSPRDEADFDGDVRVVDGDAIATARRAELRRGGDLLRLIGDARLVLPEYVVWADTIIRWGDGSRGEASGHVKIVDPGGESVVTGDHAVFDRRRDVAIVDRAPRLLSREQGGQPLYGTSRVMAFHRVGRRVVMVDSVRIRQGRHTAAADTAVIHGRERVVLTGAPWLDDGEGSTMTARRIEFRYRDGQLDRVLLHGEATMRDDQPAALASRFRGLPDTDVLTGDTISIDMADQRPRYALVVGDAHSIYVPEDTEDEVAYNDVAGDTIGITFRDQRVRRVDVRGHMSGNYYFVRQDSIGRSRRDSVLVLPAPGDTTAVAAADTLAAPPPFPFAERREKVDYQGHRALFDLEEKRIVIAGEARMVYGTMDLTAQQIRLELQSRELYATGEPLLVDGTERIAGRKMGYDFEHRSGAVKQGATSMEGFFYVGEEIKRFADGSLKIHSGRMTSCDLAQPHYHFWADKMMIRPGDKVVARPIVMKVGHVPVFALPFYFKSLKAGRKSGILFPTFNFGWSERTGRYIRDWGYYWATNDYTDFTFRGDYNERRELTWQLTNGYVKRYAFHGNVSYSRRTTLGDDPKTREWQFRWNHEQQTLFDYYRFRANMQMSSRSISRSDLINDVGRDIISGQQTSTVYLSRSWSSLSASLNFKRDEFVNREDDDPSTNNKLFSQGFPILSVSVKSRALLPARHGGRGSFLGDLLRNTYLRQSYSFRTQRDGFETTETVTHSASGNASLDFKPPRIWIFNVGTGVSASHSWTRRTESGETFAWSDSDSTYVATPVDMVEEQTQTSLSINSNLTTTLYGLFSPHIGRLRGIRHTLRFGVSHRLAPSIPGKQRRSESFGLSLNNRFDVKYLTGAADDSTAEIRKLDGVLDWNLTTSYNPQRAPDERWSNISSTATIRPGRGRNLRLTVNNTIDPYRWRVLSTRLTYGLNLDGRIDTGAEVAEQQQRRNSAIDRLGPAVADTAAADTTGQDVWSDLEQDAWGDDRDRRDRDYAGFDRLAGSGDRRRGRDETENGRYIPWRLSSNLSYNRNNITGTTSARASLNVAVTLTRNWDLTWRGSYDFERGALINQTWTVERDLHCWQLRFTRSISAVDSQFGFILALKAIPDIKVTRGKEDLVGGLRRLGGGIF